ncbi:MAG TPA: RedB protein [Verrucomicrobiae bacterium]|jgi:hypothetical protein
MAALPHRGIAQARKERSLSPVIPVLWLGLALWGAVAMMSFSSRPGSAGAPPAKWPMESSLASPAEKPALLMFVHPYCGCCQASLSELATLMKDCQGRVNARVLFFRSGGQPTNWVKSDLWRRASQIPGVSVASDLNGRQARLFGVETSGEVILYGEDGRLRFQGGVTLSRGHLGENPGRAALTALISHKPSHVTQTPVFGCPIFGEQLTAQR